MSNFEKQFKEKLRENNIEIVNCKYCDNIIIFMKCKDLKIKPFNLDLTKHNCYIPPTQLTTKNIKHQ